MKNIYKIAGLVCAMTVSAGFVACGGDSGTSANDTSNSSETVATSSSNSPLTSSSSSVIPSSSSDVIPSGAEESSSSSVVKSSSSLEASSSSATVSSSSKVVVNNYNAETGILTDERDGETYKTTQIGDQIWMAQNLRYLPPDFLEGCDYRYLDDREKPDSLDTYGRGYSWMEATKMSCDYLDKTATFGSEPFLLPYQGICPDGWHVPELEEWKTLIEAVDSDVYGLVSTDWVGDRFAGTEKYGFNVLPPANHTHVQFIMVNNAGGKNQTMVFDNVGMIQMHTANQVKTRGDFYLRCIMD